MTKNELTNVEIALYALYKLGGAIKKVHTEYIAWEAYQLAPEKFSWRLPEFKKRGFPDKTPVRYALEASIKNSDGALVEGRAGGDAGGETEGWILTFKGVEWIKKNRERIIQALEKDHSRENLGSIPIHPREASRFLKKIKEDPAFLHFVNDGDLDKVTSYMLTDMLDCTPDASKEIISKKFERLMSTAGLVEDKYIIKFLEQCGQKFSFLSRE